VLLNQELQHSPESQHLHHLNLTKHTFDNLTSLITQEEAKHAQNIIRNNGGSFGAVPLYSAYPDNEESKSEVAP
jgi:hypothetical protein